VKRILALKRDGQHGVSKNLKPKFGSLRVRRPMCKTN